MEKAYQYLAYIVPPSWGSLFIAVLFFIIYLAVTFLYLKWRRKIKFEIFLISSIAFWGCFAQYQEHFEPLTYVDKATMVVIFTFLLFTSGISLYASFYYFYERFKIEKCKEKIEHDLKVGKAYMAIDEKGNEIHDKVSKIFPE